MKPLSRPKIDDLVYQQMLHNIRSGIWESGDKIPSESKLTKSFEVSRNTVRSAIQKLNAIGLVQTVHGKGTYVLNPQQISSSVPEDIVLDLTTKEFNEMNALREAIETKAAELVYSQGKDADLSKISDAYYAMKKALAERDIEEYTRQDYTFHMSIIIASNNEIFIQIMTIFKNLYFKYFKELNKFIFEIEGSPSEQLKASESQEDSHTILYHYFLQGKEAKPISKEIQLEDIMKSFTSGNKKSFLAYLKKRQELNGSTKITC